MKKNWKKPSIVLLPTRCDISTLSSEQPEDMNRSRRNLLMRAGLIATVGHINLYGGSGCNGNGSGNGNCGV